MPGRLDRHGGHHPSCVSLNGQPISILKGKEATVKRIIWSHDA